MPGADGSYRGSRANNEQNKHDRSGCSTWQHVAANFSDQNAPAPVGGIPLRGGLAAQMIAGTALACAVNNLPAAAALRPAGH
jgi:hypothetical protein